MINAAAPLKWHAADVH